MQKYFVDALRIPLFRLAGPTNSLPRDQSTRFAKTNEGNVGEEDSKDFRDRDESAHRAEMSEIMSPSLKGAK